MSDPNLNPPSTLVLSRPRPGVAQVTMARPAVFNAFDEQMIAELDAAFTQLAADDSVRVIVLAGEGKHFSAGADLQWMQRASTASVEWNVADARKFAGMLARIEACPKPTVARVQGAALGGGVGLACACDIAIAADNASFSVSEAKFGILPSVIGPYVTNAVGKRQAKRLALTTTRIAAPEALAIGLVQQVTTLDALDAMVNATVKELLAGGPDAQREIKTLFGQLEVGPITPEVRELTAQTIARVRGTDEAREGFAAFLGKRPANWIPQ
ncbi:enoyl-CoA hydratase/isomerase family protein [Sphaerotilus montanus]|uniref:Methylglutaconyl-CoA hydratase n=1 Tax=Sphaerotilus montanus TaxID=522889 RepID=A0A7Y9QVW7_9BURK|nr:enoyl-CoA hydratase-related protein [Sphaerotilus montanus]NYG32433.1 methylglutaconyl-CoA hydratase [Sphaerotilus montanus]NZD57635.1 enoyl-CoA hydratase/isomerase family protein [Sphaerotilus montanus]